MMTQFLRIFRKHQISIQENCCNTKGATLIVAILILAVLLVLGTIAIMNTTLGSRITGNYRRSIETFYIAEAGLQRAIGTLKTDVDWIDTLVDPNDAFAGDNTLGNGTYVVQVFQCDPSPDEVRIRSTGNIGGANGSSATVEAVVRLQPFSIFDYAVFTCGSFRPGGMANSVIKDGPVFSGKKIIFKKSGVNLIENANVYAIAEIELKGDSQVIGGNVLSNKDIILNSPAAPNVDGDATSAANVTGSGTVTGTTTPNAAPPPVVDLCTGPDLADLAITAEVIQNLRDYADTTIVGDYVVTNNTITYTGIVHVTGNLTFTGDVILSGNVAFVVDGTADLEGPGSVQSNPPGFSVTFVVPAGDFTIDDGDFHIDGTMQVGTVNDDGSGISGGHLDIKKIANLSVNGSVAVIKKFKKLKGDFSVTHTAFCGEVIRKKFTMRQWRDIR